MTYYDVIGVPPTASQEDIRHAYRLQIRFFHPDTFTGSEDVARIKTLQLNEAYSVLCDPAKRAAYDRYISSTQRAEEPARKIHEDPPPPPQSRPSPVRRRKSRFSSVAYYAFYALVIAVFIFVWISSTVDSHQSNPTVSAPAPSTLSPVEDSNDSVPSLVDDSSSSQSDTSSDAAEVVPLSATDTVYTTSTGSMYHLSPNCVYLKYSMRVTTFGSATAGGLKPCLICFPDGEPVKVSSPDGLPDPVTFHNGQTVVSPSVERVCPLDVSVQGDGSYYVYLDCLDTESGNDLSFLIKPDSSVSVLVPLGNYEIYYATGDTWYGPSHHFGDSSHLYKTDDTFHFTFSGNSYYGYTLELYPQYDGNLSITEIDAADFPE